MAKILKGAPVTGKICERVGNAVEKLRACGVVPTLAFVRVGEREDDIAYEKSAAKRCQSVGIDTRYVTLPADVPQDVLIDEIKKLNNDDSVHGILLFRPLPKYMDNQLVGDTIAPEKDVDGITSASLGGVFIRSRTGFPPCTARACIEMMNHYRIDCAGKRAVVIGRSLVVGKPVAMMLLAKHATVTVCHSKTEDIEKIVREADIVIAAVGAAKMVTKDFVSPGQVVIDVGINVLADGSICGDVDYANVEGRVAAITPVPGGVGGVTTAVLLSHVVEAAERKC